MSSCFNEVYSGGFALVFLLSDCGCNLVIAGSGVVDTILPVVGTWHIFL